MYYETLIRNLRLAADKWEKNHPFISTGELRVHDALRAAAMALSESEPVRHERWVFDSGVDYCYKCSECRQPAQFCHGSGIDQELTRYCPNCGAKMDLE